MSLLKVVEVLAESNRSFDAAAQNAVTRASKSVRTVTSVYLKEMNGVVVNAKISS